MRRGPYRLIMAAAFAAAGCQSSCNEDCLTGAAAVTRGTLASGAGAFDDPTTCGGVEGLRLVLETVSGNGQLAPVGSLVQPPPEVRLLTAFLRTPVENIPVTLSITSGGGRFSVVSGSDQVVTVITGANGHATIPHWVLGPNPGSNSITASVDAVALNASITGTPQTISVTATAAATIAAVDGNNQTGAAGALLPKEVEVLVLDAGGSPVQNYPVAFSVATGGGRLTHVANSATVAGGPASTDFFGRAKAAWVLGTGAGPQTVTVTAAGAGLSGSPVTFTANAIAGPAHTLSLLAGNTQTARVNTALTIAPAVRLVDANNNPVSGVVVTFTVTQGGGTVQGATPATDANGVATVGGWTLGAVPGPNGLRAQAAGTSIIGNPVDFVATGTVESAVVAVSGDGQTASAGLALPIRPSVRVTGSDGTPIVGIGVIFQTVAAPGIVTGSVTGGTQATDQNGVATVGAWTLANLVGSNRLIATVNAPAGVLTGNPVTFTATGVAGTPVIMAKVSGDNGSAPTGFSPEVLPTVRVTDFFLNPVAGVTITFAVTGGGGTVTGGIVVTDAQGRARVGGWQLGPTPGTNTLSATANVSTITGNPAFFTATGFLLGVRAARP